MKSKYDRFGLTMPKGNLDKIKAHAETHGESVNSSIGRAIDETMERDETTRRMGLNPVTDNKPGQDSEKGQEGE